jgi:hypothetical protein
MSVSSIPNTSNWITQLSQLSKTTQASRSGNSERTAAATQSTGGFADAISLALSQVGIDSTANTSNPASSSSTASNASSATVSSGAPDDATQALSSFMQSLLAALHAQGSQSTAPAGSDQDGDNDQLAGGSALNGKGAHQHNLQADLQSLIQNLSASSASSVSSTDSQTGTLQQSFQNLLSSLGSTGSSATLPGFLKALAGNVPGASMLGNVVSILA